MRKFFILIVLAFLLSACAHAIPEQYRQAATQGVSLSQIFKDPDTYMNGIFIFGGTIVDTTSTKEGSEIQVIHNPVNRYGEITDRDVSAGRLILIISRRLDPLIYKGGRALTFAEKLTGTREKSLAGVEYRYPVFEAEELHLWKLEIYYMPYPWGYDPFYRLYFYPYW